MPLIHAFLRPLADHTAVARVIQLVDFDETGTNADLFKLGDEFPLPALVQSALENTSLDAEAETLQHLFDPSALPVRRDVVHYRVVAYPFHESQL